MNALVLDVRANGNTDTGIARYGHRLLIESRARLERLGGKVYAIVRNRDLPRLGPLFASSAVELIAPADDGRFLRPDRWLADVVADIRPDLFYTTNYLMDEHYDGPFVFTIHDLIRLLLPETGSDTEFIERYGEAEFRRLRRLASPDQATSTVSADIFGRYLEVVTRTLAAKAARVATVSAASTADIMSVLGAAPDRISVVPSAVGELFHPRDSLPVRQVRSRLSVSDRYFLYVGLAGSHKRVDWLIRQFLAAAPDCPRDTQLIIVGGDAEQRTAVQGALTEVGRTTRVVLTGWISDDDVASLYTGAVAYVSASVKEGFGLPPAEALACGSEAIVTDIPAHREVLGGHAHYYAVDDHVRLRELLVTAANGQLPALARGYAPPTWQAAADEFVRTIHEALESA